MQCTQAGGMLISVYGNTACIHAQDLLAACT